MSFSRIFAVLSLVEACSIAITATKKASESIAKLSTEAKEESVYIFGNIELIGENLTALHRKGRILFYPSQSLGSLTLEEAKTIIPALTYEEAKEIHSAYLSAKNHCYKPAIAASKLSQDLLADILRKDLDDKTRAETLLDYVFNPNTAGTDLNYVCRNYLLEKKINGIRQDERQESLTCGKR